MNIADLIAQQKGEEQMATKKPTSRASSQPSKTLPVEVMQIVLGMDGAPSYGIRFSNVSKATKMFERLQKAWEGARADYSGGVWPLIEVETEYGKALVDVERVTVLSLVDMRTYLSMQPAMTV